MNYNNTAVEELLKATEGETVQFKEATNHFDFEEATKICSALANCGGGLLVLGISDKRPRKVVGSNAFDQPERTRAGLTDKLHLRIDFRIFEHEGKRVLIFIVPSHPIGLPVDVEGIAWWYDCDRLIHMPEVVRRSIYSESGFDFSGQICKSITIADLDESAISVFRTMWVDCSGNNHLKALSSEQLLYDCGAVTDEGVTYAGLILFGSKNSIGKYLPHSEVVFEYRSSDAAGPAAQREEFKEGFFNYNDRIWELVNLRNDKQHYEYELFVFPVDTFRKRIVREALLNAISHRDYQLPGSIFVRQYHDKLVVENPGGFPHGITVENIIDRQSPRNRLIANIFQLCGLVERSGQGMNLIYELTVRDAKPLPDYKGTDAYFVKLTLSGHVVDDRIVVLFHTIAEEHLKKFTTEDYILISMFYNKNELVGIAPERFTHLVELGVIEQTSTGIKLAIGKNLVCVGAVNTQNLRVGCVLTDNECAVVIHLLEHPSDTQEMISDSIEKSRRTVQLAFETLKDKGAIENKGTKQKPFWKVTQIPMFNNKNELIGIGTERFTHLTELGVIEQSSTANKFANTENVDNNKTINAQDKAQKLRFDCNLTDAEYAIVIHLLAHPSDTQEMISNSLDKSRCKVQTVFEGLKNKKIIENSGTKQSPYWSIKWQPLKTS
jgi:ATP-dependent DNA helicase RecG